MERVWTFQTTDTRLTWILQLLSALEWLEENSYTHGDLKLNNMGIDENLQLQIFDIGSVRHRDEEGFHEQVQEDHFSLATCIHFLASGVDPIAEANSHEELKQIRKKLKEGHGVIDDATRDFKEIVQAEWTGSPQSTTTFSQVHNAVADIIGQITRNGVHQPRGLSEKSQLACDEIVMEKDPRWMDEADYRAAWRANGFQPPENIWS